MSPQASRCLPWLHISCTPAADDCKDDGKSCCRDRKPRPAAALEAVAPENGASFPATGVIDLKWTSVSAAAFYRIEVSLQADGKIMHAALVRSGTLAYRLPPFVMAKAVGAELSWRIVA